MTTNALRRLRGRAALPLGGLLLVGASLSACTAEDADALGDEYEAEEDEELEDRIHNGTASTEELGVVRIFAWQHVQGDYNNGFYEECSGTLYSDGAVVSAKHCFCTEGYVCSVDAQVDFFDTGISNTYYGAYTIVGDVVVHPTEDLAVIKLREQASDVFTNVDPVPVASSAPTVGTAVTMWGFAGADSGNCFSNSLPMGNRRKANVSITGVSAAELEMQSGTYWACNGDSGGGIINGSGQLVGSITTVYDPFIGDNTTKAVNLATYADFLLDNANVCPDYDPNSPDFWNQCSSTCQCYAGQGDCDGNADCQSGLFCAHDVGPDYGLSATADMCEQMPAPWLHVEFAGCNFGTPQFLVTWGSTGNTPDSYDVDLKQGFGSYQPYNGGGVYNGSSGRNDTFRVRVCRGGSCSSFTSRSTGSKDCLGDDPPHPL